MRAFIASDIDAAVRRQLTVIQERLRTSCPQVRWVRPENVHLTLKFLGEIRGDQVVPVGRALDTLAAGTTPFELAVEGLGAYPPRGPARVVWVGVVDSCGALAKAHAECERLLAALGFPPEHRAFSPHLTLARVKDPSTGRQARQAVDSHPAVRLGIQSVEALTLYQSTLTPQGPRYQPLSRHAFSGS
jgi:2'-5' RNA ligase